MSLNLTVHKFFFPENDFLASQWRISLGMAISLHILAFAAVIIVPALTPRRIQLPTVYTVNLFTVEDMGRPSPAPGAASASRPSPVRESTAKPMAVKKPAPSAALPTPVSIAPETKAISLKPLKIKTKIAKKEVIDVKKKLEEVKVSKALERLKTDIKVKEAENKADQLKQEALESIRSTYQKNIPPAAAGTAAAGTAAADNADAAGTQTGNSGNTLDMNSAMRRYYAAAVSHIQEHWILPDLQNWEENLEAVVVVNIRRDGVVTKSFFENKSENVYFNQFVMKTLREASPLPPFPADLKESSIEIGFRFHPKALF